MKNLKNFFKYEIISIIEVIGMIAFVLCSAFCMRSSGYKSLVIIECAYLFIGTCNSLIRKKIRKIDIKNFIVSVSPATVIVIIVYIMKGHVSFVDSIARIATVALIIPLVAELSYYDRKYSAISNGAILRLCKLSFAQKLVYKPSYVLSRLLVIIGFILTIFVKSKNYSNFLIVVVVGCVFWGVYKILGIYIWRFGNFIEEENEQEDINSYSDYNESAYDSSSKANKEEKTLNEHDVYLNVKKIAERWRYKEDSISAMLPGGCGSIRYNVSVEIIGFDLIKYTINAKLSYDRDKASEDQARAYAASKINNAAGRIIQETKSELSKCNLPHTYSINANIGNIE